MHRRQKGFLLILVVILLLGGTAFLCRSGFFTACTSQEALQDYISRTAPYAHLFFFLVQLLSVVLAPIPSNITAAAGGVLFGTWGAFFLTFSAVVAGSVLVFLLARSLGQDFVDRVVSRKLSEKYRDLIERKTAPFLLLAFLFPYFPDDVLCILAGLTKIPLSHFFVLLLLARPWGLLFASALGGASFSVPPWGLALIGVAGVALFYLGMRYGERAEAWIMRGLGRKSNQ